jgi:pimeloyl-ACP methyl ester carboxylesterase
VTWRTEDDVAKKILIVHGYSDGSTSFTGLGEFFIRHKLYLRENVFYLDYSSMDDQATFRDFADKLDADHRVRLGNERVDVACHSTGSLVVRAWLALHAQRTRRRLGAAAEQVPCPVERLLCFAPANFGSDLAGLGQSYLGKFRTTFFNSHAHKEDFLESGKAVLQGLEPASPFQWELSEYDLHGLDTYFSPARPPHQQCFPFVFAAGEAYSGVEAKLVKQRGMLGTDGTVRIPGTSLNTRGCSLDFREEGAALVWWPNCKHDRIPFAVFAGFNHGSIIDSTHAGFEDPSGPGTLAVETLEKVGDLKSYQAMAERFDQVLAANQTKLPADRQAPYQQFFFKVRDDVDMIVEDFFIDFHVANRDGSTNQDLTLFFEDNFAKQITRHSTTGSHRVFLMNCGKLHEFHQRLIAADAVLMLEITGVSPLPGMRYEKSSYPAFDPKRPLGKGEPTLLFPHTTTMVDVVLNRKQTDTLLVIKDVVLGVVSVVPVRQAEAPTGRATLVANSVAARSEPTAIP